MHAYSQRVTSIRLLRDYLWLITWRVCRADEITEASVAAEAATGKAYFHSSTDIHGRPVIVIRVNKHITSAWLHCRAPLRTEWAADMPSQL